MKKKACMIFSAVLLTMFGLIALRLAQLTLVQGDELAARAADQRLYSFDYYQYARGDLYDRCGRKLTGLTEECLLVVPAVFDTASVSASLAPLLECSETQLVKRLSAIKEQYSTPYVVKTGLSEIQARAVEQLDLPGVLTTTLAARYDGTAAQLIGSVQSKENGIYYGVSGLEAQYDELLRGRHDTQIVAVLDATGALCDNTLYVQKTETSGAARLELTLDRDYQQVVEQAFRDLNYTGTAVIMDPENGDILALASAPSFDPYGWETATSDAYVNKAFSLYAPASSFKTLLCLAALENGTELPAGDLAKSEDSADDQTITICSGYYTLSDGRNVYCAGSTAHGELDMARALAVSCNSYFVALGQILGGEQILHWAKTCGLAELVVIGCDIPDYNDANFLNFEPQLDGEVANASLGEAGVRLSVIQEAVLTAICVNGGQRVYPRLVSASYNSSGAAVNEFSVRSPRQVVSTKTADTVKQMLIGAAESGTAAGAQGEYFSAGGKTGSSETGTVCFSGFAPSDEPKWVISVFVENGTAGGYEAAAVFKYIIDRLALLTGLA